MGRIDAGRLRHALGAADKLPDLLIDMDQARFAALDASMQEVSGSIPLSSTKIQNPRFGGGFCF